MLLPASRLHVFDGLYRAGKIELELARREISPTHGGHRGAVFSPTAYGRCSRRQENANRRHYVQIDPRRLAFIKADRGDRWGQPRLRKGRAIWAAMAMAAKCTVAQVREIVPLGALDPEAIVTPGICVKRVVKVS